MKRLAPVLLFLIVAGCNRNTSTGLPTAVTPLVTETFNGNVDVGGLDFHDFTVPTSGEVDITLTAAGPPSTIFMGIGVGTPTADNTTCTLISTATTITQARSTPPQLTGTAAPGTFCVQVYDVGNQSAQVAYTVTVAHP
jgi:hypothetical protein